MSRLAAALFVAFTLALGVSTAASAQDVNCDDVSPAEAQAILDADPSDPNDLDRDNDGFACDNTSGGGSAAPAPAAPAAAAAAPAAAAPAAAAPAAAAPSTSSNLPRTGAGSLAGDGAGGALVALLGLAGVSALAALRTRRA